VTAVQRRWRLDLAYRGQDFHGFAAQPHTSTVAGALARALATVLRLDADPTLVCAGRTDAGVHALGQVVHVDLTEPLFADDRGDAGARLARSCNRLLAPSIVVASCAPAPDGFDARHSARSRSYRYLICDAAVDSPLLAGIAWQTTGPLDVRAMTQAAYAVLGEHDFRAFCRRPSDMGPGEPIVRRVLDVAVESVDDPLGVAAAGRLIRVDVTAQSFCHQMVRSIVAALVEAGRHACSAADVTEHLRSGERAGLPAPAPPEGLCLLSVAYA
jgi:tRNA pseudouridine38-40 synthase